MIVLEWGLLLKKSIWLIRRKNAGCGKESRVCESGACERGHENRKERRQAAGQAGVQHLLHLKSKSKILQPIEIMGFFYEIFCQIQGNNLL